MLWLSVSIWGPLKCQVVDINGLNLIYAASTQPGRTLCKSRAPEERVQGVCFPSSLPRLPLSIHIPQNRYSDPRYMPTFNTLFFLSRKESSHPGPWDPNFPIWKKCMLLLGIQFGLVFNNCLVCNNWCLERVHANAGCDSSSLTRWALSLQGVCSCRALRPQTPTKAGSSNSKAQHLCREDGWQTHWIFATVDESEHVGMLQTVMVV